MLLALLLVASLLGRSAAGVASGSPTGRRTTCASRVASVRPGR